MAQFIKADGIVQEVQPKNKKDFSLEELKAFVGGYIEIIQFGQKFMVVNEDGKLIGLPFNDKATKILLDHHHPELIAGDVLICDVNQIK